MKKELLIHFGAAATYVLLITIFKGWFDLKYFELWVGAVIGTLLPDVDHLLYIYLRPHELTSQRVSRKLETLSVFEVLDLLAMTRSERSKLIFHAAPFQALMLILTFLVVTSSNSLLGMGLTVAFLLHLLVDQLLDLMSQKDLTNWFHQLPISLNNKEASLYWGAGVVLLVILTSLM
ncbi:MAG: hypothetical protein ACD_52C00256G0007 [uncultured bacterium]|uniref:Uncharacterized protein n=1 Tax=Candidatus Woesebacteria bacterium RIFCSPHIGHO2_12_FULL_41_24 TaxID=1802510 RepID=A0A1F8ASC6_9BACT|nr:MAG: hypothetical protein ACD_52C00256G0007 [uncultured bacterium]OGM15092.1 MAG: hypothetical protein A2W15_06320 [Candidatus Woesebacteria bacterium RBG_16_41_13]OGM28671.1 MAG: hypothetical protein A2873_05645 [Candidatus Woesebacteria bacterium RIFCSPHIGHO2_01_FULL_42_80]OGM34457.1 MAG: hypothetical protein A3D84_04575 [Candidatus Woesebacteria bacterium RIFCSPHIGHO2_02_FULL_42_20]OGM54095.1 MAG: hypothetical protein A3E44_02730 [Candidatus Woesebacteria bacterium RIFCSPHIGHO2_12_FULL_41